MSSAWTTVADIRSRARRRWDDGTLLRSFITGAPFPVIDTPLRGPRPSEIGDDLSAVQTWVAAIDAARHDDAHFSVDRIAVGGRSIGRNSLPSRALVTRYEQAWALLGVAREVRAYREIVDLAGTEPTVHAWVVEHPLQALQLGSSWPALLSAYRWLAAERGSDQYLRQITAPGVDTKFVERHRAVLAQLLSVPATPSAFVSALGLRSKPEMVRLRAARELVLFQPFTEATLRLDELAAADVSVRTAVIVENEITYLSVPIPAEGVVLWGKGFDVSRPGSLPWLRDVEVQYWGDLDTHGFAILHRLRAWLPQTRSLLMDRDTLLAHRDRWGREPTPTAARLDRLTPEENALYKELVENRHGDSVRLEQERLDWRWALERLPHRDSGSRTPMPGPAARSPLPRTDE